MRIILIIPIVGNFLHTVHHLFWQEFQIDNCTEIISFEKSIFGNVAVILLRHFQGNELQHLLSNHGSIDRSSCFVNVIESQFDHHSLYEIDIFHSLARLYIKQLILEGLRVPLLYKYDISQGEISFGGLYCIIMGYSQIFFAFEIWSSTRISFIKLTHFL